MDSYRLLIYSVLYRSFEFVFSAYTLVSLYLSLLCGWTGELVLMLSEIL